MAIVITVRNWTPPINSFSEAAFGPYVTLIGQVALAWSDLHERLALLFGNVTNLFMERLEELWKSQDFDRARRKLLRAAIMSPAPNKFFAYPKLTKDILWMLNELDELEQRRNDVVHAPLYEAPNKLAVLTSALEPVQANLLLKNKRALNLAQRELQKEFTWCRNTILVWRDFAAAIDRALLDGNVPWPDRPVLPVRPQKKIPPQKKFPT